MIKVRLVPNFLFYPKDCELNEVYDKETEREVFYIECEFPCIPCEGSVIPIGRIKDEIFNQYSHLLLRFNKNLCEAIDDIRECLYDDDYKRYYKYLRKSLPDVKNVSNIDILRAVIYNDFDSAYDDYGFISVNSVVMFPNSEMVYLEIKWQL